MPTYAYACTVCDHTFDIVQSFTDDTLSDCPECTGRLRKVFNSVGVVFKGSGFYKTDSRASTGSGGSGAASTSAGASSGESTASASADSSGSTGSSAGSSGSSGSSSTGSTASSVSSTGAS